MRHLSGTAAEARSGFLARSAGFLANRQALLRDYFMAVSGSAGRLVFSLIYFVALANTLSIADFGRFATASAAGVMLSRIVAFGFVSTLYRIATVKPRLLGVYTGGFLALGLASTPALFGAAWLTHRIFFAGELSLQLFLLVVAAEALLWRLMEVVVIVNNGMGRFGRAALLVILGTILRAAAATVFAFSPNQDLAAWTIFYLAANAASLVVAVIGFYPWTRLRLRPRLYWRRLPDSLYVAGAELLFYLQMEMDKLLVLAVGGPHLAGIYAIIMRLVDLTAIPIRTFSMMLVQQLMRKPRTLDRLGMRIGVEGGIFTVSTAALLALAILLHFFPNMLGRNVAEGATMVALALCVPGLRNLVEYHAELLFARGRTFIRAVNLALLAVAKAGLLYWALVSITDTADLIYVLNPIFAALYLASALLTYSALRLPPKKI